METEIISTEESKSNRISSLIHECKCDFNENKGHGDNAQLNERKCYWNYENLWCWWETNGVCSEENGINIGLQFKLVCKFDWQTK